MELKSDSSVIIINSIGKYSNNHPRVEFKRGDVQIGNLIVQDSSIFFGKEDGNTLNNARNNVGIGIKSLNSLTSGDDNVAIGYKSMKSNESGERNTAIGVSALFTNDTGHDNTAIGYGALSAYNNSNNTAIGSYSLNKNMNVGNNNTACGFQALRYNTNGQNNTACGYNSLRGEELGKSSTGGSNTAIGNSALQNYTSGFENVAIGNNAGNKIESGNQNVIIGSDAFASTKAATNQIVIGADVTGKADNTAIIGNSNIVTTYLNGDVDINSAYVLPKTAGTKGQVLKYPASGKMLEWNVGGGAGESEGNVQIGDSSLYTNVQIKPLLNKFYVIDALSSPSRFLIRDVTTDSVVTTINNYTNAKSPQSLVYLNGFLYILDAHANRNGIDKYNFSTKTTTQVTSNFSLNTNAKDMTTDGQFIFIANVNTIKKLDLNNNNHTDITPTSGPYGASFGPNVDYIICIGTNLYFTAHNGDAIRKISTGGGSMTTFCTLTSPSTENKGGLTSIGTDLYYGDAANNKIYKIPTTGDSAGSAAVLQKESSGHLVLSIKPCRLSNDGTNLYVSGDPNGTGAIKMLKIPINNNGKAGTVEIFAGYVASNSPKDGNGTAAEFSNITEMIFSYSTMVFGENNIAIGKNSLYSNTVGGSNVAIGAGSLEKNTNGSCNVASGDVALQKNTSGSDNTATGCAALWKNTTGNYNVGTGRRALWNNTTGNGNVATGFQAGDTLTTGGKNICIGHNADVKTNNDSYSIVIGADAKGMGDNTVVLGDLISVTKDNIQVGDSSLYTNITNGPFQQPTFYVADNNNRKIRKVSSVGVVTTIITFPNSPATDKVNPMSLAYLNNNLYILDTSNKKIIKLDLSDNSTVAISAIDQFTVSNNDMTIDGDSYLYVANNSDNNILRFPLNGTSSTTATVWTSFTNSKGIIYINKNLYVTKLNGNIIYRLSINAAGSFGDSTTYATIPNIHESPAQNNGGLINIGTDIYFGDISNQIIYKISPNGTTGTVSLFVNLSFSPYRLSHDGTNLYAWDNPSSNHEIFKIPINSNGTAGTVVSFVGSSSSGSTDGIGSSARFYYPFDMIPVFTPGGKNNISIGEKALYSNTFGNNNVAIGYESLYKNTYGINNTTIGYQSLYKNTSGFGNVGLGAWSLHDNTTGFYNTAIGRSVLSNNTNGKYNTATGYNALQTNSSGERNTAIGYYALQKNSIGERNTAIGYYAGITIENGDSNVIIGYGADVHSNGTAATNSIVIGAGAKGKGHRTAVIGNATISKVYMAEDGAAVIHANGSINTSDLRLKKDINNVGLGLEFINNLRPVTYRWKKNKQDGNKLHHGLIAQEVESVLQTHNMSKDTHSIVNYDEATDKYGINYNEVTIPLIKAVQELSEENIQLKADIAAIKSHLGI